MKTRLVVRSGVALGAAAWILVALPGLASAQGTGTSGTVISPTVAPSQLPRSGSAGVDQLPAALAALGGAGALVSAALLRRRGHAPHHRRRQ